MVTRIVIVGAGYGGVMAALRLAGKNRRQPLEVTLINGSESFVERLRLHEYAARGVRDDRSIRHMLRGTSVQFVSGWMTALDVAAREVVIDGMRRIGYDYLIYALGSGIDRERVPGAREHADALDAHGGAERFRERLLALGEGNRRVLIVGGGATGIEAAAEIKAMNPRWQVGIVTEGEFGAFKGKRVQKHLRRALDEQGITVYEQRRVTEVRVSELVIAGGSTMPFDLCLWAGGFAAPPLAREAGIQVNERGQILLDPYLRSVSHPEVYAVGDAGLPLHDLGAPYRMSSFMALVMGAHVADNLTAALRGRAQQPLGFSTYGQAIALGPRDGIGFFTYPSDHPIGPLFRGGFAVRYRDFFVKLQLTFLELERRFPGFFTAVGKRRYKIEAPAIRQPARTGG